MITDSNQCSVEFSITAQRGIYASLSSASAIRTNLSIPTQLMGCQVRWSVLCEIQSVLSTLRRNARFATVTKSAGTGEVKYEKQIGDVGVSNFLVVFVTRSLRVVGAGCTVICIAVFTSTCGVLSTWFCGGVVESRMSRRRVALSQ